MSVKLVFSSLPLIEPSNGRGNLILRPLSQAVGSQGERREYPLKGYNSKQLQWRINGTAAALK